MNVVRNISVYHLARLFLLGGVASLFLALVLYSVFPIDTLVGAPAAGVIEEAAKLAIVILALRMMRLGPKSFLLNGMLIGATIGAGFAAFESAGYAFRVLLSSTRMLDNIVLRGVLSPFSHIAWTAIAAAALWRVSEANSFNMAMRATPGSCACSHYRWACTRYGTWAPGSPRSPSTRCWRPSPWWRLLSLLQTGLRQVARAQAVRPP